MAAARRRRAQSWLAPSFGLSLLGLWWLVTSAGIIPSVFLPSPVAVVRRLILLITQGGLLVRAAATLEEAVLGCLMAACVALPLAWMIAHWKAFARTIQPYVAASQAVPAVAVAPLLVLWIGYGTLPIVVLCAFMVFFPITVTVVLGLLSLDRDILDAARLDGAGTLTLLLFMELPMALPAILAGLRTGFTLSITGAVIGEMIMGGTGLGMVLSSQRDAVDSTGLFATITLLCVLATSIHGILTLAEQRSATVAAMRTQE